MYTSKEQKSRASTLLVILNNIMKKQEERASMLICVDIQKAMYNYYSSYMYSSRFYSLNITVYTAIAEIK